MRSGLRSLLSAGISRTRFTAIFAGVSAHGHIILTDIKGPAVRFDYTWASQSAWKGRLHLPGDEVHFEASIAPYEKKWTGEEDFGFDDIQEVRE
jgi:hypothetical protein